MPNPLKKASEILLSASVNYRGPLQKDEDLANGLKALSEELVQRYVESLVKKSRDE